MIAWGVLKTPSILFWQADNVDNTKFLLPRKNDSPPCKKPSFNPSLSFSMYPSIGFINKSFKPINDSLAPTPAW